MGQAVAGAAGGAAALFSFCNLSSPQGLWITMNQFQLILLLLLTKSNIPNSIVSYLSGLKATTCSFNFIPFKNIPGLNKLVDILDFSLPNKNLDYFGIFSGSTFANNFSLICFLMIFIVIHSVFLVINKNIQHRTNWNMCSKCMKISYQFFTFTFYIRIFLEASQFLMLSSFSEIYQFNVSSLSNIISILFAIIGSMLCLWLVCISFIGWLKQKDVEDMDKYFPLKEFFNGIKNGKVAKLYSMLLLCRRFVFVALLIFGGSLSNIALICPMIIVQIAYLTNLIIVRPYKQVKNNVIEIVNECFYFLLVTLLSYFNTSERWSKTIETVYFCIILTNSFIIILIMITAFCITSSINIKERCNRSKINTKKRKYNEEKKENIRDFSDFRISNTSPSPNQSVAINSELSFNNLSPISKPSSKQDRAQTPAEIYWQNYNPTKLSNLEKFNS